MACSTSSALLLPLLAFLLLAAAAAGGAGAEASELSPPMARRAGPVPPPPSIVVPEKDDCPLISESDLIDACRSAPGLRGCAAQCIVYHHRGGYCDMLPNGMPAGDCYCMDCLAS